MSVPVPVSCSLKVLFFVSSSSPFFNFPIVVFFCVAFCRWAHMWFVCINLFVLIQSLQNKVDTFLPDEWICYRILGMLPPTKTCADVRNDSALKSKDRPNILSHRFQDRAVWPILQLFGDSPVGLFTEVLYNNVPFTFNLPPKYITSFVFTLLAYSMEQSPSWEANWFLQLIKKFPAFYGTRKFITLLTSARHLFLSWTNSIQSPQPLPTSWRSILILSSHPRLGLPNGLLLISYLIWLLSRVSSMSVVSSTSTLSKLVCCVFNILSTYPIFR